jgi:hypothetical protein
MMGFSEEPGIIPRFCEDLFAQVAQKQTQEVCYVQIQIRVMATKEIPILIS